MSSKLRLVRLSLRQFVVPFALLLAVVSVAADTASTVTGVSQTGDSDTGSGERWGRAGGRTLTFSVGNTATYATLFWGASAHPSAAFDNGVNTAGEIMTLDNASNLNGGVARWNGSALLPLSGGGSVQVPTRFTLTVTSGGGAVPLTTNAGGAVVGLNVKPLTNFTANLLFEAQVVPGLNGAPGQYMPILDFYDVQPTPIGNAPGTTGPVLTSFARAFYYTNAGSGMTVDTHDQNEIARFAALQGTANQIKDGTEFLRIEVPGRLGPLQSDVTNIKNNVQSLMQQGGVQIPSDLARRGDVQSAKNDLSEMLMILFGLMPCPADAQEVCDQATLINEVATQASVDEIKTAINALAKQSSLDQLGASLNGLATNASVDEVKLSLLSVASHSQVEQVKQQLIDLAAAVDGIKQTVSLPAVQRLDVQVVETSDATAGKKRRWLVRTSVAGAPVSSQLSGLVAIAPSKSGPSTATQVLSAASVTQLMPGLMEVTVEAAEGKLNDLSFNFSVTHAAPTGSLTTGILIGLLK